MAVTNYDTVNGRLRGEVTSGVRTGYVTDALGSVTATVQSAAVVNTYRYKPYGSQLAKTGAGAEPKFQWVGTTGYRRTSSSVPSYVRARHIRTDSATWTSLDLLWPAERSHSYCDENPVSYSDPSGFLKAVPVTGPKHSGNCGGANLKLEWRLEGFENLFDGWLVQRIENSYGGQKCGTNDPIPGECKPAIYWEAWRVKGGKIFVDPAVETVHNPYDSWGLVDRGPCTHGSQKKFGRAKLMKIKGSHEWHVKGGSGHNPCAIDLMTSNTAPPGWEDAWPSQFEHYLIVNFGCCCGGVGKNDNCPAGPYKKKQSCSWSASPYASTVYCT